MTSLLFFLVIGAAAALAFGKLAGMQPRLIGLGLVIAAIIYVGFAAVGHPAWLGIEFIGVLIYGVFTWLGLRKNLIWLAIGWALHMLWDVALHSTGTGASFTPGWYVAACIGFDLAIAGMVVYYLRHQNRPLETDTAHLS